MGRKVKPSVSVVIPTYKRANVLPEALSSVQAQQGAGELFDMEIVVVDDGSPDNTSEIMKNFPDVHYIRLEKNQGQYGAVNIGIKASKGEFIALLDDDDLWLPNRLKDHLPVFQSNPDVGVVYGQIRATGDGNEFLWPDTDRAPSGDAFLFSLKEELVLPMCIIIRRTAFEKAGYFDDKLRTMGHYDMFLRLSYHVPFVFVPGAIAIGRFSEDAKWFSNIKSGENIKATLFILERALAKIQDPEKRKEYRRQTMISWFYQFIFLLNKADQPEQIRKRILETLKNEPYMLTDKKGFSTILFGSNLVTKHFAKSSNSPISVIRNFVMDVKAAASPTTFRLRLKTRQLRSTIWLFAAYALKDRNIPAFRRKAGFAAFFCVILNPFVLRKSALIITIMRSIFCQNFWNLFLKSRKKVAITK